MKKVLLAVLLLLAFPLTSYAAPFATSSGDLAASADSSLVRGNVRVALTNTSTVHVRGLQYGLTSPRDIPLTGNTPVTKGSKGIPIVLIKKSDAVLLSGLPLRFDPSVGNIKKASFEHGTALTNTNLPVLVPEPATMLLFGIGLIGISIFGRKRYIR